ncbi:MAG: COG1470 family protein, partial [Methanobacteriota archaeon]
FRSVRVNISADVNTTIGDTFSPRIRAFESVNRTSSPTVLTLTARVHDYGIAIHVDQTIRRAAPGEKITFLLLVNNTGNGNDTINLNADLTNLLDWQQEFQFNQTFIENLPIEQGQSHPVLFSLRLGRTPLAAIGENRIKLTAKSVQAAQIGNRTETVQEIVVDIPDYVPDDVDRDGFLELAIDRNKRFGDGFEQFVEVFTDESRNTRAISTERRTVDGDGDRKADFFVDKTGDGLPDLYWDPDDRILAAIENFPTLDFNRDGTQEFLSDTNGDGVADKLYEPAAGVFFNTVAIDVDGDGAQDFLIDTNEDGRPDWYFNSVSGVLTKVAATRGKTDTYSIDTDNDGIADKRFNTETRDVTDARVQSLGDFVTDPLNAFMTLLFLATLVAAGIVLWKRRGT